MGYFNQTVGRVANRIKDGIFTLNAKTYQLAKNFAGNHHGHDGPTGFFMREFEIVNQTNTSVKLKYVSKHLEEDYILKESPNMQYECTFYRYYFVIS